MATWITDQADNVVNLDQFGTISCTAGTEGAYDGKFLIIARGPHPLGQVFIAICDSQAEADEWMARIRNTTQARR